MHLPNMCRQYVTRIAVCAPRNVNCDVPPFPRAEIARSTAVNPNANSTHAIRSVGLRCYGTCVLQVSTLQTARG